MDEVVRTVGFISKLYRFSDKYPRDSFRFWFSHVFYNLSKDVYYLFRVRRF